MQSLASELKQVRTTLEKQISELEYWKEQQQQACVANSGLQIKNDELSRDLEFAYKRSKVLADLLEIPVHESPEVTGTILGLVRGSVERLIAENHLFKKETVALASESMKYKAAMEMLFNAVYALSGEFDKPVTDENAGKWLRLNKSQKVVRQLLEI